MSKIVVDTNREVVRVEIKTTKGIDSIVTAFFESEEGVDFSIGSEWEGKLKGERQDVDISDWLVYDAEINALHLFFSHEFEYTESVYSFEIKTKSVLYYEKMSIKGTLKVKINSKF